jgi:hypothetical protein
VAWLKYDACLPAVTKDYVVHTAARLWPFTFIDDSRQNHLDSFVAWCCGLASRSLVAVS